MTSPYASTTGAQINPYAPSDMKTLVYSPEVKIFILHNGVEYDVSADVIRGWVDRRENAAATLSFVLANKPLVPGGQPRYNAGQPYAFSRMDVVTVYLKRTRMVQVFTGFLDQIPYRQLHPGPAEFRATCTLKKLINTWWNPGTPANQSWFGQRTLAAMQAGDGQNPADSGLGGLLRELLVRVGGWNPAQVHIQNFPIGFLPFVSEFMNRNMPGYRAAEQALRTMFLGANSSGPMKSSVGYNPSAPLGAWPPPGAGIAGTGAAVYLPAIVAACDQRGMGPSTANLQQANAITQAGESGVGANDYDAPGWQQVANLGTAQTTQENMSDAAILAVACILVESQWRNFANPTVPESSSFSNDGFPPVPNLDSVGLFQQRQGWGCLPAWSQVFTSTGPVPIVDVQEGDEVWSFDGQRMALAKVTGWQMTGYKKLLTIRTHGRKLEVTANHRIPIRRYFGIAQGRKPGHCGWETIEVCAGEIIPGDYLIVPFGMGDGAADTDPSGNKLTPAMMELVGLYLGDGNCDGRNRIEISHGHGVNEDHMPYYRKVIKEELGVDAYTDKRGTRTRFSSPRFGNFVKSWLPGRADTKRIPGWMFRLTPELQLALVRGYIDADGSVDKKGRISWTSVSRGLTEDIRHILILLGVPTGTIEERNATTRTIKGKSYICRTAYTARATSVQENGRITPNSPHKAANIKSRKSSVKLRYSADWNSSVNRRTPMGEPPEGTVYHKVISVHEGNTEVPVYDIEVDGLHHYVADGIVVHNTVGQRMNPFAAAGMFYDKLASFGWRNMNEGAAIFKVQVGASPELYAAQVPAATALVQAYRKAQAEGTASLTSMLTNTIPAASSVTASVTSAINTSISNYTVAAPTSTGGGSPLAGLRPGKPVPDSEGAINAAMMMLPTPYQYGGKTPGVGLDCSGLTNWAFRCIGVDIGEGTTGQAGTLPRVYPSTQAQRGDLIWLSQSDHIGIYLGGGQWINTGGPEGTPGKTEPLPEPLTAVRAVLRACPNGGPDPSAPFTPPIMGMPRGMPAGTGQRNTTGAMGANNEGVAGNLFSFIFEPGTWASDLAGLLPGEKQFIDGQPLIQMVQAVCKSGLRNFQSAPNGDFMAYTPDEFGQYGKPAVLALEDIEIRDLRIDLSDEPLTTHVYVDGDYSTMGVDPGPMGWVTTAGVATMENEPLFSQLRKVAPGDMQGLSGKDIMRKFGVRPFKQTYTMVSNPAMEFLLAMQIFMGKFSSMYIANVTFTFMPELYPGMRVLLRKHGLQMYCSAVTHTFDYENGFTTRAVLSSPSDPSAMKSTVLGENPLANWSWPSDNFWNFNPMPQPTTEVVP